MKRAVLGHLILMGGLIATTPMRAESQWNVQVVFTLGDDGWVTHRPAHRPDTDVVYYDTPRQRVRVPPGHMPRPGYCRIWYPGVPPGHQPRPERCDRLFRLRYLPPGAVIVGSPARYYYDAYDYDDDDDDGRRGTRRGRGDR
jgi:hypothetical protein